MSKRLTLGFFIHQMEGDYAQMVVKGAVEAATDCDVNIVFFPGRPIDGNYRDKMYATFEYQNNILYRFATKENLDGLVVAAGTVGTFINDQKLEEFILHFKEIPVLTTERKVAGFPCLRFNADGMYDVVRHLIEEHNCRDIKFVAGPRDNPDSFARLNAYRRALEDCGLEYSDENVVYGNFSEYTVELIDELLDHCKQLPDAICFANDDMCIGAYKSMAKRKIIPGKDIMITGFDNSTIASTLKPKLTTVKADAELLGYTSVMQMYAMLVEGKKAEDASIPSSPVYRESCGCIGSATQNTEKIVDKALKMSEKEALNYFVEETMMEPLSKREKRVYEEIKNVIAEIVHYVMPVSEGTNEERNRILGRISELLNQRLLGPDNCDSIFQLLDALHKYLTVRGAVISRMSVFTAIYRFALDEAIHAEHELSMEYANTNFMITNISKDMMLAAADEKRSTLSLLDKLRLIDFKSSYIYRFDEPFANMPDSPMILPERIRLLGYQIENEMQSLDKVPASYMPCYKVLANEFMTNTRKTMVLAPLFSNEMQYGVLVCDMDHSKFSSMYYLGPQISTSITINSLFQYLEGSLERANNSNDILKEMSIRDELTGVLNRRGFFRYAQEQIKDAKNKGKMGMLVFADLDNLKKINDGYGHEAGDYAICTAADYLKKTMHKDDVVARIGGDEFAAFAFLQNREEAHNLYRRIKELAAKHNEVSDKPFNVCVSLGMYTFTCAPDVNLQTYLEQSDAALYEDKKRKNPVVAKKSDTK